MHVPRRHGRRGRGREPAERTPARESPDLTVEPEPHEQRFGRIHRIKQRNVCHMWSLLAKDTREGDVFERLLAKIEQQRAALGKDRVFDVLGTVFTRNRLRDLMVDAIKYGDDPKRQADLRTGRSATWRTASKSCSTPQPTRADRYGQGSGRRGAPRHGTRRSCPLFSRTTWKHSSSTRSVTSAAQNVPARTTGTSSATYPLGSANETASSDAAHLSSPIPPDHVRPGHPPGRRPRWRGHPCPPRTPAHGCPRVSHR